MPSTWGLRRRPKDLDEEDPEILQERYAARLEELLRVPREPFPEDDTDLEEAPDAGDDLDEPGRRVALRIGARPAIRVVGDDAGLANHAAFDEAVGVDVPDPTLGEDPTAVEVPAEAATVSAAHPVRGAGGRTREDGSRARKPAPRRKVPARGSGRRPAKAGPPTPPAPPAACPYCAVLLEPAPRASGRCPRCRHRIVVRRAGPRLVLLTEAAVPVYEAERRRTVDHSRFVGARDRWLRLATAAGAPEDRVRRLASGLASQAAVEAARALYLTTVDRAFRAARIDRHWELAEKIRRRQAAALYRLAGRPVPPPDDVVALYREGVTARLRGIAEIAREAELRGAACCAACAADDGRLFRVSAERHEPRLPHPGCPDVLCRCRWTLSEKDVVALRKLLARQRRAQSSSDEEARTGG